MSGDLFDAGCFKWVACGCAGCLLLIVVVVVFVIAVGGLAVFTMAKSEPYREALDRARHDPVVVEALGEPVEPGLLASGSVNVDGAGGAADLRIPVSGPRGKGTLFVSAARVAGRWEYSAIVVELADGGRRIDVGGRLLAAPQE
jgi:hypothetical protein